MASTKIRNQVRVSGVQKKPFVHQLSALCFLRKQSCQSFISFQSWIFMPLGLHIHVFIAYHDHITLQSLSDKEVIHRA